MTRKKNRSKSSQQYKSQHASSSAISAPEQSNVDHEDPACTEYFDASDCFDPSEIQETPVDAETGAKKRKILSKESQENSCQHAWGPVISAPEQSRSEKKGKFLSKESQENNCQHALSSVISAPEQSNADHESPACTEYFDASEYFDSPEYFDSSDIQEPRVEAETSGKKNEIILSKMPKSKKKEIILGKMPQENKSEHTSRPLISAPGPSNSNVEDHVCPVCTDDFDPSEIKEPLCSTCRFEICAFCYHKINYCDGNGLCPKCRTPYPKDS